MQKKIGLFIPAKNPGETGIRRGIAPTPVIEELIDILGRDPEIACYANMDLTRAIIKNGHVYIDGFCLSELDMFFWFYLLPSDLHSYELDVLRTLARRIKVVPNPFGVARGLDKFTSHTILRNAGLPTADFCLFRSDRVQEMEALLDEWGCLLLKPTLGSFGHGITMVHTRRQLVDAVQYAASFSAAPLHIFCERFEKNNISQWISTTIINGELVYGYRKRPEKFIDGWKVYDPERIGGHADYIDPSPVAEIALAAAEILSADIIGFDFILSERMDSYVIVDENTLPGMYPHCFEAAGKGTWAEHLARLVKKRLL